MLHDTAKGISTDFSNFFYDDQFTILVGQNCRAVLVQCFVTKYVVKREQEQCLSQIRYFTDIPISLY